MIFNIRGAEDVRKLNVDALPSLAKEVREMIIDTISKNGGHLASSLGATDLIIALHWHF